MSFWQRWSQQKLAQTVPADVVELPVASDALPFELPTENLTVFWQSCHPTAAEEVYVWQPLSPEECQRNRHWLDDHEDSSHG